MAFTRNPVPSAPPSSGGSGTNARGQSTGSPVKVPVTKEPKGSSKSSKKKPGSTSKSTRKPASKGPNPASQRKSQVQDFMQQFEQSGQLDAIMPTLQQMGGNAQNLEDPTTLSAFAGSGMGAGQGTGIGNMFEGAGVDRSLQDDLLAELLMNAGVGQGLRGSGKIAALLGHNVPSRNLQ